MKDVEKGWNEEQERGRANSDE
jgi:hypothetical protein